MNNSITRSQNIFSASGYKSWSDNKPAVEVLVNGYDNTFARLDLTIEEATQAIEILKAAVEEANNEPDHDTSPWDQTLF